MARKIFPDDIVGSDAIRDRMEELEFDHEVDGEQTDAGTWDEASQREYRGLAQVIQEIGDPRYNTVLINERHFSAYIKELWLDVNNGNYAVATRDGWQQLDAGDVLSEWPFSCIDWEAAAEEQRSGYSVVEVDGVTYYWVEA